MKRLLAVAIIAAALLAGPTTTTQMTNVIGWHEPTGPTHIPFGFTVNEHQGGRGR